MSWNRRTTRKHRHARNRHRTKRELLASQRAFMNVCARLLKVIGDKWICNVWGNALAADAIDTQPKDTE